MASSASNLLITGIIAIFLLALAFLGLAVGWLITGKSRLQRRCGFLPGANKKKNASTCPICKDNEKESCHENIEP